jgi:penicillin-binding protein 1B
MPRAEYGYSTWRQAPIRRAFSYATSVYVLAPLLVIALILIGVLYHYYSQYSQEIERRLSGDVFVQASGIYAAPRILRPGGNLSLNGLISHLKNIGYLDRATAELTNNERKGQYLVRGAGVEIYPGPGTIIDGAKAFDNIRATFTRDGNGIQSLSDLDTGQQLNRAEVEPELISSVVNQGREKRKIIGFKDLPRPLVDAITSVEDRSFFDHSGISLRGILRALFKDYQAGELKEGGSSITQQLVKSFFLTPDKTWTRKLQEAYMAIILEQRLNKQEILAMYCNQIYLGQRGGFSINGFGEAARAYFGKDVAHLDLSEAALLAGIIKSPNYYSPFSHQDRALYRRNQVLDIMVEAERLTRDQAEVAKKRDLGLTSKTGLDSSDAPYFVDYMTRQLERVYDESVGSMQSLRIYSTIDLDLQHAAVQAVTQHMKQVEQALSKRRGGTAGLQAALVAMNPKTGEILAMVGGRDYAQSQLNRAVDARRQPGSVFKPFVYAAALGDGVDQQNNPITPATTFSDEPRTFDLGNGEVYNPGNFGDKYEYRPVTVRDALVHSKNVIAVQVTQEIGFRPIQTLCERAGLTKIPAVTSVALGVGEATPLQLTSAYSAFANGGRRVLPVAIRRVTTKEGQSKYQGTTETREVMSPQVAYVMTSMLQDVLDRGTGTRVRQMGLNATAAGKTGSSRDGWFAGYTPNLVCVVWVGFDNNDDLGLTGGVAAAPIWTDFMIRALRARPELGGEFEDPGGIVAYEIDPATGAPASGEPNARRELFIEGTNPGGGRPVPMPERERPESDPDSETEKNDPDPGLSREPRIAGVDTDLIPLPPGAADKIRPRDAPTPTPGRGFFGRLKDIFTSDSKAAPKPTPTPAPGVRPRPAEPAQLRPTDTTRQAAQPRATPPPRIAATPRPPVATRPRKVEEPARRVAADEDKGKFGKNQKAVETRSAPPKLAQKADPKKSPEPRKTAPAVVRAVRPTPTPTPTPRPPVRATPAPTLAPLATPAPQLPTPAPAPKDPRDKESFLVEICATSEKLPIPGVCPKKRARFTARTVPVERCKLRHDQN